MVKRMPNDVVRIQEFMNDYAQNDKRPESRLLNKNIEPKLLDAWVNVPP